MIEARRLTRTYGRHRAVAGIDFRLEGGGVYGFLGPNGAGKTTTLRMITGCIPPTSGELTVDGVDVVRDPLAARRRIGYLPESTPIDPGSRVRDYLRFRADLAGVPRRDRAAAIDRAITACDLESVRRRFVRQLSKGFRQRVGLAAAILHAPPVLVLDEPTVGLDPRQIVEVRRLVRRLAGEHTVILSTHILPEAESVCDEILMFAGGRIRARGRLSELRQGDDGRGPAWSVRVLAPRNRAEPVLAAVAGVIAVEPVPAATARGREDADPSPAPGTAGTAGTAATAGIAGEAASCTLRVRGRPASGDEPADDLGPALAAALGEAGLPLAELARVRTSLEERFIEIVTAAAEDDRRTGFDRDREDAGPADDGGAGDAPGPGGPGAQATPGGAPATAASAGPAAPTSAVATDAEPASPPEAAR